MRMCHCKGAKCYWCKYSTTNKTITPTSNTENTLHALGWCTKAVRSCHTNAAALVTFGIFPADGQNACLAISHLMQPPPHNQSQTSSVSHKDHDISSERALGEPSLGCTPPRGSSISSTDWGCPGTTLWHVARGDPLHGHRCTSHLTISSVSHHRCGCGYGHCGVIVVDQLCQLNGNEQESVWNLNYNHLWCLDLTWERPESLKNRKAWDVNHSDKVHTF